MILDPERFAKVLRECFRRGLKLPLYVAGISRNHQLYAGVYETDDGELSFRETAAVVTEEPVHSPVNFLIVDAEGKGLHAITAEDGEPEFLN